MYQNSRGELFSKRLNEALTKVGAPSRGRAKYIQERLPYEISLVAIRKWLNGDAIPNTKKLSEIAAIAGTTVEKLVDFESGTSGYHVAESNAVFVASPYRQVPVLSTVQAGNWTESLTFDQLGEDVEWQTTAAKVSEDAFAVRVKGSSMTNPHGHPSLPDGSIAVVQPCPDPDNGKIVVAMLTGSDEATIKKLEKEGPFKYLVPLNPKFDPIAINGNCRIIGYVKEVIMRLD